MGYLKLFLCSIPALVFIYFWTKHDLENKRGWTVYDEKGNKIESFGEWLDGKGKKD